MSFDDGEFRKMFNDGRFSCETRTCTSISYSPNGQEAKSIKIVALTALPKAGTSVPSQTTLKYIHINLTERRSQAWYLIF